MVLAGVEYELFEWEIEWYDQHPAPEYHELNRQLRLLLADRRTVYVTWDSDDRTYYKVAHSETSYWEPADVVYSATDSGLWRPLVGQRVELSYLDPDQQVLAIRGGDSVVYCCTYRDGLWGVDFLRVTGTVPQPWPGRAE
jgi:hypothetical protein